MIESVIQQGRDWVVGCLVSEDLLQHGCLRFADWCMYTTGRDSPYNLHRVSRRGDDVASQIYFGQAIRRVMELAFAIEQRYAPYPKWQHRLLQQIGGCGEQIAPLLPTLITSAPEQPSDQTKPRPAPWPQRVHGLIAINHICAHRLYELGLTTKPIIRPFDEGLTDLTLYESARQIYAALPTPWRQSSFNQIESWEKLARVVLFDSGDYFQRKYGA